MAVTPQEADSAGNTNRLEHGPVRVPEVRRAATMPGGAAVHRMTTGTATRRTRAAGGA